MQSSGKKRGGGGSESQPEAVVGRGQVRLWFLRLSTSILLWTGIIQLTSVVELWHPHLPKGWPVTCRSSDDHLNSTNFSIASDETLSPPSPPSILPNRPSSGAGTSQERYSQAGLRGARLGRGNVDDDDEFNELMRAPRSQICDMVTVARYLNLTLLIPELDKTSFWADPSDFKDIFNVKHFIKSLRNEVRIIKSLPEKFNRKSRKFFSMPPVSWSNEKYYLKQILPLFRKHRVINFNKTDARLANNGLPAELQRLRCQVNYQALRFTPQIESLGNKLISMLKKSGFFVVLHLRYEMDMLAFSGCTHGCSLIETEELTRMRSLTTQSYTYPWWKEKEIVSEKKRLDGLCPLTPEETKLVLQALGFTRNTRIYIASGEIYGGERRLGALRAAYPNIVSKEMLLSLDDLRPFQNHSMQMAALDYMVSVASDVFIPTYDGNMAKVVEGHRRYLGFRKTILLDRRELVELVDLHQNNTLSWEEFSYAVRHVHEHRMGQPTRRKVVQDRPKEEDYFYANPQECLGPLRPESIVAII
ncbi:hypothetical protein HHK36_017567 [Tetracentron sinense]|uniref:O-fucosyltransferase family protein n=1 Tax=Tetracentron sinense TaxID=13715 RepID=A0A835DAH0_TETSI|nr:hypothetical protein HHK36_017567 [Tetracentron sinense]